MRPLKKIVIFLLFTILALNSCKAQTSDSLHPYLSAIFAINADTIQYWYTTNFGFIIKDHKKKMTEQNSSFYLLEKDGFLLEIVEWAKTLNTQRIKDTMKTFEYLSGYFKTGFYVTNIRAWYNRLKSAGVKIKSENVSNGQTGHYILCVDPEGNLVQLFEKEN
jgi:catechol 2,3-dioxygenase-like lactoylglutathione lyase family enzyme